MQQHITKFEKSTPRQLTAVFLGIGFIGLGLTLGGADFGLDTIGGYLTLTGFVLGGLTLFGVGGAPVAVGTETTEVEDRVQIQVSDELVGDLKSRFEQAVADMEAKNQTVVDQAQKALSEATTELAQLKELDEIANLDVHQIVANLQEAQKSLDLEALTEVIEAIKGSAGTVSSNLDNLANISSDYIQKIEAKLDELKENVEASNTELKERVASLEASFTSADEQVQRTIRQFESFNQV